jgi:hypothetical protein
MKPNFSAERKAPSKIFCQLTSNEMIFRGTVPPWTGATVIKPYQKNPSSLISMNYPNPISLTFTKLMPL